MLRPLLFAALTLSFAACSSEEKAPATDPVVVETTTEDDEALESPDERMRREASERAPLVATNTLEGIQMTLAAEPKRFEPPVSEAPATTEAVLDNYAAMAEYKQLDARTALTRDLASLERRAGHVQRELTDLRQELDRVRPRSDRARELKVEIERFETELGKRESQAKLLRDALTKSK